jgi:maleate isomerase
MNTDTDAMVHPSARLGIILSSGNRTLEPYFRAFAPAGLGIHVTRMRMGSGGQRPRGDIAATAIAAAELVGDTGIDAVLLQGTGIMMERGPAGEAELVAELAKAAKAPAYTATQSVVESLKALGAARIAVVNPGNDGAVERERAYLDAVGITVAGAAALDLGDATFDLTPEQWTAAASTADGAGVEAIFLSGSHTRALEAIAATEAATGKPVVTSIQAALWAGLERLRDRLAAAPANPALGRLFARA